jgi:glycosyltransferase involved in cell wall biosynthesis
MSLGVYVFTLNEDLIIYHTLHSVKEVFPQVEVIDIGSTDNTLSIVKSMGIKINKYKNIKRTHWPNIKNEFADRHDWIFFIDGDEVYTKENLLNIKAKIKSNKYKAYRVAWKNLRKREQYQISNPIVNGCKIWKSDSFYVKRAWPKEVLQEVNSFSKEPKEECSIWCWHGVLLDRTTGREPTSRMKKRRIKDGQYEELDWTTIGRLPWDL